MAKGVPVEDLCCDIVSFCYITLRKIDLYGVVSVRQIALDVRFCGSFFSYLLLITSIPF